MVGSTQISRKIHQAQIVAISTEIGRGHPSYLDSVVETLLNKDKNLKLIYTDVFHQSAGISRAFWRIIHLLYLSGGRGGFLVKLYNQLRNTAARPKDKSLIHNILARDLKRPLRDFKGICLVAHPLLAKMLAETCSVWYVHGEIAAPLECAVSRVKKIFVPLKKTGGRLVESGADSDSIVVCGLMIEPRLVKDADKAFHSRLKRIDSSQPLTVGFFTSGAYPREHLRKILAGAKSVVDHGMKAIIFTGTNPRKLKWFRAKSAKWEKTLIVEDKEVSKPEVDWDVKLVHRVSREAETRETADLVPLLDMLVAPSHERTNWAVGLGLPIFVLYPLIGTFSPRNSEFAQRQGVCYAIDTMEKAQSLGTITTEFRRSNKLAEMAKKGFGIHHINGSEVAATHILENLPN